MTGPTTSVRVLIADDDAILREIAAAVLNEAGFAVQTVASGDEAVAACALRMPDIALLDVEMAQGDGYQACTNLRFLPGGANLPIVMVTGCDDTESIDRAYEAGATDFVVKPINWTLLTHRIRYVMRGARTIEALSFSEQKNAALLKAIPDGIFLVNSVGSIAHCFSPIEGLTGTAQGSGVHSIFSLMPGAARAQGLDCLRRTLCGAAAAFEFCFDGDSGRPRHFECRYLPNSAGHVLAIIRDITARKETDARIHRLAYFDSLTGLPNREWIRDHLNEALNQSAGVHRRVAVLHADLDQFKRINETLGHAMGDAFLCQVAQRLRDAVGQLGTDGGQARVARLGGDEFVVVLAGMSDTMLAEQAAEGILAAIAAPYHHAGYELVVTSSIGIAKHPEHGDDVPSLLKNAEGAMYEAKSSGGNQLRAYDSVISARALRRLSLEMELRRAVEDSGLELYYQPKYAARTLELAGGEALLRWFHPDRGQIPTGEFIAVAEETGLIGDIGRWVLQRACRDLSQWRADGLALPRIAVNVSGRDFLHPQALLRMGDTVGKAGLSPGSFELELTEGVLMRDAEAGRRSLGALKEFGFALAIDDFGTGYCSLNYLKRFPLDTLKIDRSFVEDISEDADDAAIVRAIIALGHSLDLKIVAEGVTTEAQLEFLRTESCDAIQGFLMSAAIPAASFAELLRPSMVVPVRGAVTPMRLFG
ncbi:MAG TPA: EAL domain-containing protein [Steroidobacteraceae bacterium]|jgi:diguanylate cyclase (GGDEF)-like protein|nr:EAL domain-containing protein [Steroidobacteraceae bacterium]